MSIYNDLVGEPVLQERFASVREYEPEFTDRYERCTCALNENSDVFDPSVSRYLFEQDLLSPEYPQGRDFAVCLTHDIDFITYPFKTMLFNCRNHARTGQWGKLFRAPLQMFDKRKSPLWNFDHIMDIEEEYGAISSFYFLVLDTCEIDHTFDIEELGPDAIEILDRGWEIGLHGGYETSVDLEKMISKKSRLEELIGKEVIGYRNHYLRFNTPLTWELLSQAGFKYDTTFGYSDCPGFRNGMCHPFRPYDVNKARQLDILEIPLHIMDRTLFEYYMRLDMQTSWKLILKIIDTVARYRGVVTILWHNSSMTGNELKLYEKILAYCQEKNAWITSGEQLYNWWKRSL